MGEDREYSREECYGRMALSRIYYGDSILCKFLAPRRSMHNITLFGQGSDLGSWEPKWAPLVLSSKVNKTEMIVQLVYEVRFAKQRRKQECDCAQVGSA
jgi:hypothetical protein